MKNLIKLIMIFLSFALSANMQIINKSIYDYDNREFVSFSSSPEIQSFSQSIGLIFNEQDLQYGQVQSLLPCHPLSDKIPLGSNICPDQKFAGHLSYRAACTGFLVGKSLFVTAGHCFRNNNDCHNKLIVFNVTQNSETNSGFNISNQNIFRCHKIISRAADDEGSQMDYALIQLDRDTGRPALKIRSDRNQLNLEDSVFMIGHPLGLPLIYTGKGSVEDISNPIYFKTTLNSFHGNSGSPVFNYNTHLVEGILVSGEADMDYDQVHQCNRYTVYSSKDNVKGEAVTRIQAILPFIFNRLN